MNEIWREIPGWEGHYAASTMGRIKGLKRDIKNQYGNKEHILNPSLSNSGYLGVNLHKKGIIKRMTVARIVALTFPEICGEWFEGAEIDHINTIKTDNRAENIRWTSRQGQFQNKTTKINLKKRGDHQGKPIIKLSLNNEILHFYPSIHQASRDNNISITSIYNCCSHKRHIKTAGGFIWKYAL